MGAFTTKKLTSNKRTFQGLLKTARRRANVTLEQAEVATKIPLKYLQALEEGDFSRLPAEAYNVGYVRCYAQFLHINPEKAIQMYREQRSNSWHQKTTNQPLNLSPKKISDWHFLITPRLIGVMSMIIVFAAVAGYIITELRQFTSAPELLISSVASEFTTDKDQVMVEGKTSAGATLSINSEPILVNPDGTFRQEVQLSPGINEISIQAKSKTDKSTRKVVKALYNQNLAQAPNSVTSNEGAVTTNNAVPSNPITR